MMDRLVTFVCLHGAGKSRIAAALFNAAAPPGWQATSAGLQPQQQPSQHAVTMLTGDRAAVHLDTDNPRPLDDNVSGLVVGVDCDVTGAQRWDLAHAWPDPRVLGELRTLTDALIAELDQTHP